MKEDNQAVIKALNMYGRVPEMWELLKEIERLKEELKYTIPIVEHNKTITKHLKEIKRLNNIINELEKYFEQEGFWHSLDKIKELKGSESNE